MDISQKLGPTQCFKLGFNILVDDDVGRIVIRVVASNEIIGDELLEFVSSGPFPDRRQAVGVVGRLGDSVVPLV